MYTETHKPSNRTPRRLIAKELSELFFEKTDSDNKGASEKNTY